MKYLIYTQKLLLSFLIIGSNLCYSMKQDESAGEGIASITLEELLADFKDDEQESGSLIIRSEAFTAEQPKQLSVRLSDQQVLVPWQQAIYSLYFEGRRDDMRGPKPRPRLARVFDYLQSQKVKINRADSEKILADLVLVHDHIEKESKQKELKQQSLESLRSKAEEAEQILKKLEAMDESHCATETIGRFAALGSRLRQQYVRVDSIFQQHELKPTKISLWKKVMTYVLPGYYATAQNAYNMRRINRVKIALNTLLLWPVLYKIIYTAAQYTRIARSPHLRLICLAPGLIIGGLCSYGINKIGARYSHKKYG